MPSQRLPIRSPLGGLHCSMRLARRSKVIFDDSPAPNLRRKALPPQRTAFHDVAV